MSRIILIRHGKTEANQKRLYCGSTDLPLSPDGIAELNALRASVNYPDISGVRVVTSGMLRCEQTLQILFGDIPHEIVPELREMDFGAFEMRSYEQMKNDPDYIAWISGDNDANIAPGGESGNLMKARVLAAFSSLTSAPGDLLIIAHGGTIAIIMSSLFPDEPKNRYEWQPGLGRGYEVRGCGDAGTRGLRWGQTLPPNPRGAMEGFVIGNRD